MKWLFENQFALKVESESIYRLTMKLVLHAQICFSSIFQEIGLFQQDNSKLFYTLLLSYNAISFLTFGIL